MAPWTDGPRREMQDSAEVRHLSAVKQSLASAEAAAARGEFADALLWIRAIEATGEHLSLEFQSKRGVWQAELAQSRRGPERITQRPLRWLTGDGTNTP